MRPFFPPIRRVRPYAFGGQGRFVHRPVEALPIPGNALHLVVLGQPGLPQMKKKALLLPSLKVRMHRAGTAEFIGKRLPLTTGSQHINDGRKYLARRHRRTTRARLAAIWTACVIESPQESVARL